MNTALAFSIESAMEKRRNGPYSKPSHLRLIRPDDDDDTVVVLQKAWIVDPEPSLEPVRAPVGAVSAPEYQPGLFVRLGDAVIRQLGLLLIISAIVGMTVIGYWTGFNERVVLDTIAKVETLMADGLPAAQVPCEWDRVTGERICG